MSSRNFERNHVPSAPALRSRLLRRLLRIGLGLALSMAAIGAVVAAPSPGAGSPDSSASTAAMVPLASEFGIAVSSPAVRQPSELAVVSGDAQSIAVKTASKPMVVQLIGNDVPLAGRTIHWTTTGGSLSHSSTTTDANGNTSVTLTPTTSGEFVVTATFPGDAQFSASQAQFDAITTVGGVPSESSDDQSVGVALNSACSNLTKITHRTQDQQDLLEQCLALSKASAVSASATVDAIHQISPTVAETQAQTAKSATSAQFHNLAGRMNALRSGARGASFAGLAFVGPNGSLPLSDIGLAFAGATDSGQKKEDAFSRWGMFASGQIGHQDASAQANTPGYSLDSRGVTIGLDYRASDQLVLGGAIGYTHQSTDLAAAQGNLTMKGWNLSGYATWYRKNDWYVDGSLTWGDNTFDSRRNINYSLALGGGATAKVNQTALASSGGNDLAGSVTFGRDFHRNAIAYGIYGKLQYDHQIFDAFQETLNAALPGKGLGLRLDSRTTTSVASVLGGKIDWTHSTHWGVLIPHAEAEWQHEFRTDPGAFRASFINDPTNAAILFNGDPIDSDFFRLGLGMSMVMPKGRSAFVLYDQTLGRQGITQYEFSFGFRIEF